MNLVLSQLVEINLKKPQVAANLFRMMHNPNQTTNIIMATTICLWRDANSNPSGSDATKEGKSNIKEDIEENDDNDGENEEDENLDYDESKIYIEGESTEVFPTSSSSSDDRNEAQSVDISRALIVYQSYFVNEVAGNVGYVVDIVVDVANSDVLNEDAHTIVPYVLQDQNTLSVSSSKRKCIARCLMISGYENIVVVERLHDAIQELLANVIDVVEHVFSQLISHVVETVLTTNEVEEDVVETVLS
ncbi:hypothetical protein L1987_54891 [Smallanthus sonchifolius]|uniref:Uncharacterized protein n=1 Tax=Smallanthus sonchifolius TaxID=185202 RepID=A0ACB9E9F9_9ASTR|nr:hypothetical protein L1987_54891 [Smallanthus sonchifolius]